MQINNRVVFFLKCVCMCVFTKYAFLFELSTKIADKGANYYIAKN